LNSNFCKSKKEQIDLCETGLSLINLQYRKISRYFDDIDGPLTESELFWVHKFIRSIPSELPIIEIYPGTGQVTCCLTIASSVGFRKIHSLWPEEVQAPTNNISSFYINWHKLILRKHLVPFVIPTIIGKDFTIPELPTTESILVINHDHMLPIIDIKTALLRNNLSFHFKYGIEFGSSQQLSRYFLTSKVNEHGGIYYVGK